MVCAPLTFVSCRHVEQRVVAKEGNRCSMPNWSGLPGTPPPKVACGMIDSGSRREELRHPGQHEAAVVRVTRRVVERARVLVRPVHADGELAIQRRLNVCSSVFT